MFIPGCQRVCERKFVNVYQNVKCNEIDSAIVHLGNVFYSSVSDDVVSTALDVAAMEKELRKENDTIFPLSCTINRTAGKYGKVVMEID